MSQIDPKTIEEYQLILIKNPRSPVFAALSEAYRKMGLIDEALEVTHRGVKHNPEFVSGLVAHARILFELKNYSDSLQTLKKAHSLKPENLLALKLMAHVYIKLKKHHRALLTYKKLQIFSPVDTEAQNFIKKWQFLESSDVQSIPLNLLENLDDWLEQFSSVDQAVHIIDSFLNANDTDAADAILQPSLRIWRDHPDLKRRYALLKGITPEALEMNESKENKKKTIEIKKLFYQRLLRRVEQIKGVDPL